ncbi:DELTA-actitoxin-Oor1b-like [Melanotaenia boesemani]|uniref:DELTA-actitoxin-Oor1b-like n=1 Tax=Melanotaenia boesemani TaxID=1250792 RepID=UPI001C055BE7|nr:DELTA-actitoxin-Oor1b-like [Melanotaenia boesemani]
MWSCSKFRFLLPNDWYRFLQEAQPTHLPEAFSLCWFQLTKTRRGCFSLRRSKSVSDMNPRTHRQCSVQIQNKSSMYTMSEPRIHLVSGFCDSPLPPTLGPSESGSALFIKTRDSARGSVGVFTYDLLRGSNRQLAGRMAVMFSVPYDFLLYSNWYGVGEFDGSKRCSKELFNHMYEGLEIGFTRGKAKGPSLTHRGDWVTLRASMSDSYQPVLKVEVSDN